MDDVEAVFNYDLPQDDGHGVGGFTGTVLIGFFGEGTGLFAGGDWRQLVVQLLVAIVAIIWSAVITGIIAFALEKTIGWRVTEAQEVGGIDLADQGERAYDFAGTASSVLKGSFSLLSFTLIFWLIYSCFSDFPILL